MKFINMLWNNVSASDSIVSVKFRFSSVQIIHLLTFAKYVYVSVVLRGAKKGNHGPSGFVFKAIYNLKILIHV